MILVYSILMVNVISSTTLELLRFVSYIITINAIARLKVIVVGGHNIDPIVGYYFNFVWKDYFVIRTKKAVIKDYNKN